MMNITTQEWKKRIAEDSNAMIIDVRTPGECMSGILKGAQTIDIMNQNTFMARIQDLPKDKNLYVYCRSGARSSQACQVLESRGHTTFNLMGGVMAWDGELI